MKRYECGTLHHETIRRQHHFSALFGVKCIVPLTLVHDHTHILSERRSRDRAESRQLDLPVVAQELMLHQLHPRRDFVQRRQYLIGVLHKSIKQAHSLRPTVVPAREAVSVRLPRFREFLLICRGFPPVEMMWDIVIIQRASDADVV